MRLLQIFFARYALTVIVAAVALGPAPASAQNLNAWLNSRIDSVVAVRIAASDPAKEMQFPAGVLSDANLVDRSRMPDVAGISVKVPTSVIEDAAPSGAAFSATPYLVSALLDRYSLDPSKYLSSDQFRRIGFNLTFDTDSTGERTTDAQLKYVILDRGNPLDHANGIGSVLAGAAQRFGELRREVLEILYAAVGQEAGMTLPDFINSLTQPAVFRATLQSAGSTALAEIDEAIEQEIEAFVELRSRVNQASSDARAKPELAVGLTFNGGGVEPERLRAMLIYDIVRPAYDITFNAGYERVSGVDTISDRGLLEAAAQILLRFSPQTLLQQRTPASVTFAGAASLDPDDDNDLTFKLQARLLFPIAESVNIPLSATWASESDLVEEDELRGTFGFSFDIGSLLNPAAK